MATKKKFKKGEKEYKKIAPEDLLDHPNNPREEMTDAQIQGLASSIKKVGFITDIQAEPRGKGKYRIRAGHLRKYSAIELGLPFVPVAITHGLSQKEWDAYMVADNKFAQNYPFKNTALAELLVRSEAAGFTFGELGFEDKEANSILGRGDGGGGLIGGADGLDGDGGKAKSIVKAGEMWQLGEHKIFCADVTKWNEVRKLFAKDKAQFCFTSPPYAEQRKDQYDSVPEDKYVEWFGMLQQNIGKVLTETGSFLLNIKANVTDGQRSLYVHDLVCEMVRKHGWRYIDEFSWLRIGCPQRVVNRFKNAFEPIHWFTKSKDYEWYPMAVRHESDNVPVPMGEGSGGVDWAETQGQCGGVVPDNDIAPGMAYPSNVLDIKNNAEAIGHPAAFPAKLPHFLIQGFTVEGQIVFDPFLGSGTTLIAAENLGRRCFGTEISPKYCDIIIERWQEQTGLAAEKIS